MNSTINLTSKSNKSINLSPKTNKSEFGGYNFSVVPLDYWITRLYCKQSNTNENNNYIKTIIMHYDQLKICSPHFTTVQYTQVNEDSV